MAQGAKKTVRDPGEIKGKERKTGANGNPIGKYYRQYDAEKHDQTDTQAKRATRQGKHRQKIICRKETLR